MCEINDTSHYYMITSTMQMFGQTYYCKITVSMCSAYDIYTSTDLNQLTQRSITVTLRESLF